jgi:hypothetical protein
LYGYEESQETVSRNVLCVLKCVWVRAPEVQGLESGSWICACYKVKKIQGMANIIHSTISRQFLRKES